jgi:hypothetical protein
MRSPDLPTFHRSITIVTGVDTAVATARTIRSVRIRVLGASLKTTATESRAMRPLILEHVCRLLPTTLCRPGYWPTHMDFYFKDFYFYYISLFFNPDAQPPNLNQKSAIL